MEALHLFDDLDRVTAHPAPRTELHYEFLNRSARPAVERIRQAIDDWFSHYPHGSIDGLRARLAGSDENHTPAFFELFLHELAVRLGYEVAIEPEVPGGNGTSPDFLLTKGSERLYVEAVTVRIDPGQQDSQNEKVLLDELDQIRPSDFWVSAQTRGTLRNTPPVSKLRRNVESWLHGLDVDVVDAEGSHPILTLRHDEWRMSLTAWPKGVTHRGNPDHRLIGSPPSHTGRDSSTYRVRKALLSKAKHYGTLDAPLVLAVNVLDWWPGDEQGTEILFGRGFCGTSSSLSSFSGDALWHQAGVPRYTRVAGVSFFTNLQPWTVTSAPATTYWNPWSSHVLPRIWRELSEATASPEGIERRPGQTLSDILDLPSSWPE